METIELDKISTYASFLETHNNLTVDYKGDPLLIRQSIRPYYYPVPEVKNAYNLQINTNNIILPTVSDPQQHELLVQKDRLISPKHTLHKIQYKKIIDESRVNLYIACLFLQTSLTISRSIPEKNYTCAYQDINTIQATFRKRRVSKRYPYLRHPYLKKWIPQRF